MSGQIQQQGLDSFLADSAVLGSPEMALLLQARLQAGAPEEASRIAVNSHFRDLVGIHAQQQNAMHRDYVFRVNDLALSILEHLHQAKPDWPVTIEEDLRLVEAALGIPIPPMSHRASQAPALEQQPQASNSDDTQARQEQIRCQLCNHDSHDLEGIYPFNAMQAAIGRADSEDDDDDLYSASGSRLRADLTSTNRSERMAVDTPTPMTPAADSLSAVVCMDQATLADAFPASQRASSSFSRDQAGGKAITAQPTAKRDRISRPSAADRMDALRKRIHAKQDDDSTAGVKPDSWYSAEDASNAVVASVRPTNVPSGGPFVLAAAQPLAILPTANATSAEPAVDPFPPHQARFRVNGNGSKERLYRASSGAP